MSLILDALKQADLERGKGHPPGVFHPPMPMPEAPERARGLRPLLWGLVLAALVGGLWFAWTQRPASLGQTLGQPSSASTLASQGNPAGTGLPAQPLQPLPAQAALFQPEAKASPTLATPSSTTGGTAANETPPSMGPVSEPPLAIAPPSAQTGATEPAADPRLARPQLHITGHTYSDNPNLRMLMIDGHMVVEGQALAPGLRLERIGPHQAVFNHRGTRFHVDY